MPEDLYVYQCHHENLKSQKEFLVLIRCLQKEKRYFSIEKVPCNSVPTVQVLYLDSYKVFKECAEGGVGICLASVCDSAITTCSKTLITYITVTVLAADVLAANVFGTDITH
jgi:hypothetical protein